MTSTDFNRVRQAIKAIINRFPVSARDVHVALLEYSDRIDLKFGFLAHSSKPELLRAIDRVTPSGGRSVLTDQVLAEANQLFSLNAGSRPGVPKMLVIITDDMSTGTQPLSSVAQSLRRSGVAVRVVGIGSRVNPEEWKDVVPAAGGLIPVDTTDQILTVVDDIEKEIRRVADSSKLKFRFFPKRVSV
jgi:hypothetical protein